MTKKSSTIISKRYTCNSRSAAMSSRWLLYTLLLIAGPVLAARQGEPVVFKPPALMPVADPIKVTLPEQIRFEERSTSWAVPDMEMGLREGDYVATVAAGGGVFYVGPEASFYRGNAGKNMNMLRGGFWLPDDGGEPRLFWIVGIDGAKVARDSQRLDTASPMNEPRHGLLPALSAKRQSGHFVLHPPAQDRAATEKLIRVIQAPPVSPASP